MKLKTFWTSELPQKVRGLVVVVDVYAATTNIASFLGREVKKLLVVNKKTVSLVKERYLQALVIGDCPPDLPKYLFDVSNHPYLVEKTEVKGKVVIYMTNNGTRVIEQAFLKGAEEVTTASFVNINAVVSWIQRKNLESLTILLADEVGFKGKKHALEDKICAEALKNLIMKKEVDWERTFENIKSFIKSNYGSRDYLGDFRAMFAVDKYPVVPLCHWESQGLISVREVG